MSTTRPALPIDPVLPLLVSRMESHANVVLQAPPGAGKTTGVPLALLQAGWLAGARIVMLEPRRLAARAAAARMASVLGETPGETIGYRMRLDSKVGPKTRIEVVTEGVLTRMIQDDPSLDGVGVVIFDEFHERNLAADLGLALCLEAQAGLRPDLRLLVMSATLDGERIATLLGDAPIVTAEGKAFPVDTCWAEEPWTGRLELGMARLISRALAETEDGDILAFLPGQGEIRRLANELTERGTQAVIAPLYGDLSQADQDRALTPLAGRRKVILATAIAETSLTINGVRIVVDSGKARLPRFDPGTGMTRLTTSPVSKASAEQRKGRAGRQAPGLCYRLWTEAEHRALLAYASPEILEADLAPLALELARWGTMDAGSLAWLDPPPEAHFTQARSLLTKLGALDEAGRATRHGRDMAKLPVHPRFAHMLLKAAAMGLGDLAAEIAALLSERDIAATVRDADLRRRLDMIRRPGGNAGARRVAESARQLRRFCAQKSAATENANTQDAGRVLALAYPDRIAQKRGAQSLKYRLSGGQGAYFFEPEALCLEEYLAVASLDGNRREARIFLAAPLSLADIEDDFADEIVAETRIEWDARAEQVAAVARRRLGELILDERPLTSPDADALSAAMLAGVKAMGLACLPWTEETERFRARIAFLRRSEGTAWPDLSDDALAVELEEWLLPWLSGLTRKSHLTRLELGKILKERLDWKQQRRLDEAAPTHIEVPSGSRIAIDYSSDPPVLAVRLQEMFGLTETPTIGGGVRLMLHLLSPARRPVQVTQDLASFWANAYRDVKADLKGQYPKHHWPDDPLAAQPTARAKRRGE